MKDKKNYLDDYNLYDGIASRYHPNPMEYSLPTNIHENLYQLSDVQINPETGHIQICSNPIKDRYDTVCESLGRASSITKQVMPSMNLYDSHKIEDMPLTVSVSPSLPITADFTSKTLEESLQETHTLGLGPSSFSVYDEAFPSSIQLDTQIQPISGVCIDEMRFSAFENQVSLDSGLSKIYGDFFVPSTQISILNGIITYHNYDELGKTVVSSNLFVDDRGSSIEYLVGQKYYDSSIFEKPQDSYYRDNTQVGDLLSTQYPIQLSSVVFIMDENGLVGSENHQPLVSIQTTTLEQMHDRKFTLDANLDWFLLKRPDYEESLICNQSPDYEYLLVNDGNSELPLTVSVSPSLPITAGYNHLWPVPSMALSPSLGATVVPQSSAISIESYSFCPDIYKRLDSLDNRFENVAEDVKHIIDALDIIYPIVARTQNLTAENPFYIKKELDRLFKLIDERLPIQKNSKSQALWKRISQTADLGDVGDSLIKILSFLSRFIN